MVLYLIMPEIWQEITVKIVGLPYTKGKEFFLPVIMWGDPKQTRFEMRLGKTLWQSIYNCLKELEKDPLSGFMGLDKFKIDGDGLCLKNKIITVRGLPDSKRPLVDKTGKVNYPKIFSAEFRNDLEYAEKAGGDSYKKAVFESVIDKLSSRDCRLCNTQVAKEVEEKDKKKRNKTK